MDKKINAKNACAVLCLAVLAALPAGAEWSPEGNYFHLSHVHRGGGKVAMPDNTLDTFLWCWGNGSALECDCRMTKDGVGIMLHDPTLRRTGRGISLETAEKDVSRELSWAEIRDVDVGSYLKELNPAAPDCAHHRIPTIEAVFAAMKGRPSWLCMVDEKGAGPAFIAEKAKEADVEAQVYYTGPDPFKAREWMRLLPGGKTLVWISVGKFPTSAHTPEEVARADRFLWQRIADVEKAGFDAVSAVSLHTFYNPSAAEPFIPSSKALKKALAVFHGHGIPVCSIPFEGGETEEAYMELRKLGFDAFSSDYPEVMFSAIRRCVGLPSVAGKGGSSAKEGQ